MQTIISIVAFVIVGRLSKSEAYGLFEDFILVRLRNIIKKR